MNRALRLLTTAVAFLFVVAAFSADADSDAKKAPALPIIIRELHGKSYQVPWNNKWTLKTLIISQGGLSYPGSPLTAEIRRVLIDGTESRMTYDLRKLFKISASDDPKLQPGDIISFLEAPIPSESTVAAKPTPHVAVIGGPRSQGAVPFTPGLTVSQALLAAGGYDELGHPRIYLIRNGESTVVDVRHKSSDRNIPLKTWDIIYIGR